MLDKLSTVFERTIDKHYILIPDDRFNFTEKKRLLLDKRIEVIEYEIDNGHSQVDAFIQKLAETFSNSKNVKEKSKPYDIFLSHSSKDKDIADRIIRPLEINGYKVWDFKENFKFGEVWQNSLSKALNESRFMVFLITENYSTNSKWLDKELEIGLLRQIEGKITVLPIVIGDTELAKLPSEMSTISYLRLDRNFDIEDLRLLFDALKREDE